MNRRWLLSWLLATPALAAVVTSDDNYTFMVVGVRDANGKRSDAKFFIGRLPNEGEAVEMVYVGRNADGDMRFQLRVKG